jgi:hypothetical protein
MVDIDDHDRKRAAVPAHPFELELEPFLQKRWL